MPRLPNRDKLTAAWKLTRSDKRMDVWETRYRPHQPLKVPLSPLEWFNVKRKLHDRLRKHVTKFAYVRMMVLTEEGIYQVSFEIEPESGYKIDYINTPTVPRNSNQKFTEAELFRVLQKQIDDMSKVSETQNLDIFIVAFDIVAHNGFWEKVKRERSAKPKKQRRTTSIRSA